MQEELRQLIGLQNPEATPVEILEAFGEYLEEEGIEVDADGPLFIIGNEGQNTTGDFIVEVVGLSWGFFNGARRLHINHGYALQDEEAACQLDETYEAGEFLKMGPHSIESIPRLYGNEWLPPALMDSTLELIERLARAACVQAQDLDNMRKKLVAVLLADRQG